MITEAAIVTRCDGRLVELELQRNSTCGQCELSKGCGTGALGRLLGHRKKPILIETDHQLKTGDRLTLGVSESALVKTSLTIYGMPLLGMVGAGILAALVAAPELIVAMAACAGFFAGHKFAGFITNRLEAEQLEPYIVEISVNPEPRSGS